MKIRRIKVKTEDLLKLRRIRYHDEFPKDLMKRMENLFPVVRSLFTEYSLQDWIDGFKYDMHPAREVGYWEEAVNRYLNITKGKDLSGTRVKEIWKVITLEMMEKHPIEIAYQEIPSA